MADSKITALAALTAADPVNDMFPIVDVSDTSMAASGTTKRISANNILSSSPTASGALTVTGLVTAGSATITGALTVDTTTLVVDASNDRVGIGTATPAATLNVKGGVRVDANYNAIYAYKVDGTLIGYTLFRDDGPNYFNVNSNQPLYLSTNNVAQVQVQTSGDVKINTGNVVMGTSGKGIDFTAAGNAAGMTSELLDDYEEGTWTGTLAGSTTNPTVAVTATGRYTKIGRQVYVQIIFGSANTTGASGAVSITGLPFANNASIASQGSILSDNTLTFTGSPFVFVDVSASTLLIYQSTSNAAASACTHNAGTSRYLYANLTYTVA